MKLLPKASRFIAAAAGGLASTGERDRLLAWLDKSATQEVPRQIAALALRALERSEQGMKQQIDTDGIDEDRKADLMNDIAFIRSVKSDLRHEASRAA